MQSPITLDNYYSVVPSLDRKKWPKEFVESHKIVDQLTRKGSDMGGVSQNDYIHQTIVLYLEKLNQYLAFRQAASNLSPVKKETAKQKAPKSPKKQPPAQSQAKPGPETKPNRQTPRPPKNSSSEPRMVREKSVELRLLTRFVNLHAKAKTYGQVLRVFRAINRAAEKGQVRKTQDPTPHWKEIQYAQKVLHEVLQQMDPADPRPHTLQFNEQKVAELKEIVKGYKVWPWVNLVLRFIGLQGKSPEPEKAERLLRALERTGDKPSTDPGRKYLSSMKKSLKAYLGKKADHIEASPQALNGLRQSLQGCGCDSPELNGLPQTDYLIPPPRVKGEFQPLSFRSDQPPHITEETLKFTGPWGNLFNQPPRGFSSLIYGKPKNGKSTLAADLGGYLARSFGRVLYASIEEGGRASFTERLDRLQAGHPRMEVKNYLPTDLTPYDFIITDSVSRGNLDIHAIRRLIADWPGKSFFFIFHTTKEGLPRGTNEFLHEVDVLVEVKDGVARADGRFGPGEREVRFE